MKHLVTVSSSLVGYLVFALLAALMTVGCDQQPLDPMSGMVAEDNAVYAGTRAMADWTVDNSCGLEERDQDPKVPNCIIMPELPDWPTADFLMGEVSIEEDIIKFSVSYTGGCVPHDFQLVSTSFQNPHSSEVSAQLFHRSNEDPCGKWTTETREFDLTPLRELHSRMFSTSNGIIVINLMGDTSRGIRLIYRYGTPLPLPPFTLPARVQISE